MDDDARVSDEEYLLRSIDAGLQFSKNVATGELELPSSAFNDREQQVSVDRQSLRQDPRDALLKPEDGLAELHTGTVRAITSIKVGNEPVPIEVEAKPIEENAAHAIILPEKEVSSRSFRKFRKALRDCARVLHWPSTVGP